MDGCRVRRSKKDWMVLLVPYGNGAPVNWLLATRQLSKVNKQGLLTWGCWCIAVEHLVLGYAAQADITACRHMHDWGIDAKP
jgi:hypothetical protein